MQQLKMLRRQLGVSQKDFAVLMGCSEGQLAMAESGLRQLSLPAHANLLLHPPPIAARAAKNQLPAPDKAIFAVLQRIQRTAKVRLMKQQLLAEALEKAIAAADNMQAFAAAYQQESLPELARLQLEVLRRKAVEKKDRCQLRLVKCKVQIAAFEAMLTKAAALQNQL